MHSIQIHKKEQLAEGCTRLHFTVPSPSMQRDINVLMVVPSYYDHGESFPILFGLHGMDAPFATYSEMLPMRQGVEDKGVVLCCFDADASSWYLDAESEVEGREKDVFARSLFCTFFFDELNPFLDQHFKINAQQKMITGFSMGSFGALKFMLDNPGAFVSVSALSTSIFNFDERMLDTDKGRARSLQEIFGPYETHAQSYRAQSLGHRIAALTEQEARVIRTHIYIRTGVDDTLIEGTRRLHQLLLERDIEHRYREGAGAHDWSFWLAISEDVFRFHCQSIGI